MRSVTLIDQQRGESVGWSRQTYYAGLAPAEGLTFPRSALVYPLLPGWKEADLASNEAAPREVLVEEDALRLSNGWLRSRETSQLLVIDAAQTKARLEFQQSDDKLTVTNHLGGELEQLYAIDPSGKWWTAGNIPPDGAADLAPAKRIELVNELRKVLSDLAPVYPPGLEPDGRSRRGRIPLGQVVDYGSVSFAEGRLEALLDKIGGFKTGLPLPMRPGTYVALSRETLLTPIGVPGASEEGSLHVTIGDWAIGDGNSGSGSL